MRLLITTVQKLYPSVESFSRDGDTYKAYDKDGKEVTIDKSAIDTEHAKENYIDARVKEYPSVVDQLDLIYHSGIDAWKAKIKETKDKYPKS